MVDAKKLNLSKLQVYPLKNRQHRSYINDILIDPDDPLLPLPDNQLKQIHHLEQKLRRARDKDAAVILIYGAHLIKNGTAVLVNQLIKAGWITHIATNGAGSIHDWEFAYLGASTENVEKGVENGEFGAWDETSKNIHIAILSGAIDSLGYGQSLGRFINENGCILPQESELVEAIKKDPTSHLTSARADLLFIMNQFLLKAGKYDVSHPYQETSIIASAWRHKVPFSVHPSIGYDIIANHPIFSGSAIGRAGEWDFKLLGGSLENLNGGITLSVGSAIMGPQVFEKAMSCVNNQRIKLGGTAITDHSIYVVDIQDGGQWDWQHGEPPINNPAYYLRFCKSYSRMGGSMDYIQCDNAAFIQRLHHHLIKQ